MDSEEELSEGEEMGLLDAARTWLFNEASTSRGEPGGRVLYPDESSQCDGAVEEVSRALAGAAQVPLRLRLAKNMDPSLFAHYLWSASIVLANLLASGTLPLEKDIPGMDSCVELGAGCALPSLVLAAKRREEELKDKSLVLITDYDDDSIFEALEKSLEDNILPKWRADVKGIPHNWGSDCEPLLGLLNERHGTADKRFGLILMADTLWKGDCHGILLESCRTLLAPSGAIYVAYCNHTGGDEPERFFAMAKSFGFDYEEAVEPQWLSDPSYASEDDEHLRKVHVFRMTFRN